MFQVGERIQFKDGDLATVRFVGTVAQWGEEVTALGIEWDKSSTGKNNGNIGDHQYFIPHKEGAGSFIKSDNSKILAPKSFQQALIQQYGWDDENIIDQIKFGTKTVENYGFDKLNSMNANFAKLISISLDKQSIKSVDPNMGSELSLTNVTKLDLSYNLFTSFQGIESIIQTLPKLKELNLNGNRFDNYDINSDILFPTIRSLHLCSTGVTVTELNRLLVLFPNLVELTVASNQFNDTDIKTLVLPNSSGFKHIDLSFNELISIPQLTCDNVNISNNKIVSMDTFSIRILDVRFNLISEWEILNRLSMITSIEELRIDGNPLFDGLHEDESMIHVIGRFTCSSKSVPNQLHKLNGNILTEEEIINGELYFINKVKQEEYNHINQERYEELLKKYQMEQEPKTKTESNSKVYHDFHYEKTYLNIYRSEGDDKDRKPVILNKLVLKTYTILRLYGIISKLINKSILTFNVYYFINEDLTLKQYLDDDLATINDFQFSDNQDIYIETL